MKEKIIGLLNKYEICPEKIMYIIREKNKTCMYLSDGQKVDTYYSMKKILEAVDTDGIVVINKGIAVSLTCIQRIEGGIYKMTDGRELKGRVRTPGEHKRNKAFVKALNSLGKDDDAEGKEEEYLNITSEIIEEKFSILDELPVPFAVFEIISDGGVPVDFIFRYLNKKMAELAGCTVDSANGESFYSVFKNGDKKWLEINGEVANSREPKSVRRFSLEVGRYLSVYYYSPYPGYSACVIIK